MISDFETTKETTVQRIHSTRSLILRDRFSVWSLSLYAKKMCVPRFASSFQLMVMPSFGRGASVFSGHRIDYPISHHVMSQAMS
ncbi:Uncharacterized protein HZ326_21991 [Fusarium oxysporum f. sp. albedinis]|nr:Uncharacterized protein HZ326_21991 [Fusarium oxysporum f. sp. albedinis]